MLSLSPTFANRLAVGAGYVGSCVLCAIRVPQLKTLITLSGGTCATLLCVVFPTLIARTVFTRTAWRLSILVVFPLSVFLFVAAVRPAPGSQDASSLADVCFSGERRVVLD